MVPRCFYRSNEDEEEGGRSYGPADQCNHRDWDEIQRRSGKRFQQGVVPSEGFRMFFSGSIGAFSTSKRRTKIEFFWGYPLCGTSYLWFNFLRHHRSFTIIAKESQGLKMNFNRSTSVPEQCTGLRISVLPSCSQSPPCLGLGPWKLWIWKVGWGVVSTNVFHLFQSIHNPSTTDPQPIHSRPARPIMPRAPKPKPRRSARAAKAKAKGGAKCKPKSSPKSRQ